MSDQRLQLEQAIAALDAQRGVLGDAVVAQALAPLRDRLAALAVEPDDQQLKQVTVLFADVVGSTTLTQHLDPEDVNLVMDGALQRLSVIVEAQAGKVLQYAGDSLLAVFGAEAVHEDDAQRAVLAGLAMLEEGRRQQALVLQRHGHAGFNLRVGIHTGPVLLGGGVDGAHSIRGMTVNLAARMEQTAPSGALRISHDTYRHVRGLFAVVQQPPLEVKGHAAALVTYLVTGPGKSAPRQALRGIDGLHTPLIGREAELALLQQAWHALGRPEGRALTSLTLVAEPGIGKSRLLREFRQWVDSQHQPVRWLEAHASERASGRPYGLLRDLLTADLPILDSDPPAVARAAWVRARAALLPGAGDAAVLGHLLGLDFATDPEVLGLAGEARRLRDRAFFHASQLLRALAGNTTPLLLVVDDLQWADDGTLDFIEHLHATQSDMPALCIVLTRPTLFERRAGWGQAWARHHRSELMPLGAEQATALASALLCKLPDVPASLRELVTERAEGNPFYMEELVNMLVDQGVIDISSDADGWAFDSARLQALSLPTTLVGVLQARLDALPTDGRRTAQLASVVGYRFWDDSLRALGAPLPDNLQGLIDRELIVHQDASGLQGMQEFSFKHHTLHQVTYDSVLKRIKRGIHAQVAHWLAGLPGAAPPDLVAEHFERGGEPALALGYWQRAAEAAAARYANAQALAHAGRGLALTAADDLPRRYTLGYLRFRVLELLGERERLAEALDALQALAVQLGDAAKLSEVLVRRARYWLDAGSMAEALGHARQAVACVPETALEHAAKARATVAQCLGRLGRHDEAQAESAEALALARAASNREIEGIILNDMGMHADDSGDHAAAIVFYEQALASHREVGHRNNEGGTLSNLGYAALMLGDYAAACAQFADAGALFARIGSRQNEGITLINLGIAQLNQSKPADARANATRALQMLRGVGDRWSEGAALRLIGQAALALADGAAAVEHFNASRDLFDGLGAAHLALEPMAGLAAASLARGDIAGALAQVDAVLERQAAGVSLDGTEEPMRVRWICHQVLAAAADLRAPSVLAAAHQALHERAARIGDLARRQTYLDAVPCHRDIVVAAARMGQPDAA